MKWKFEKFKGDMAIYAYCPKCNFNHNVSSFNPNGQKIEITHQYNFCPMCGEYLYVEGESIGVIWNVRSIKEKYQKEE